MGTDSWHLTARLSRALHQLACLPGLRLIIAAVRGYIAHQGANQAGSVAFSSVLAMFPLLILLAAAASFVGRPGDAAALIGRIVGFAPPFVKDELMPVIDEVLGRRNEALVAFGFLATVWAASSGMQAIRTALNRAYGVDQGLSFWKARIKITLMTLIGGSATLVAFSSVVIVPYALRFIDASADSASERMWLRDGLRLGSAFVVLSVLYTLLYGWLPDLRQRSLTVLPGAVVGAVMWLAGATMLSYAFRSAGKLLLIYGGFAGAVATLVFLYFSAVTLIFGAELNAAIARKHEPAGAEGVG